MPDLTAETLAMLAKYASPLTTPDEQTSIAHAAACVRFVAALDAGEITSVESASDASDHRIWLQFPRERTRGYSAPTALAAFRAATQDHHTGGDDGQ